MASLKDVWACLGGCFKGKCCYILKVISFIYIHAILTYLVKVNVGGGNLITLALTEQFFHCF